MREPVTFLAAAAGGFAGALAAAALLAAAQTWALAAPPGPEAMRARCELARAAALDPERPAAARALAKAQYRRAQCRAWLTGEAAL